MARPLQPRALLFLSRLSRPAWYLALVIVFMWGSSQSHMYFMGRQQSTSARVNTLCHDKPELPHCSLPVQRHHKFIAFVTDCWPVKYAKDVLDHYKDHAVTYYIDIPGAKYSHAIYTSYLTGQLPTNYKGDPIQGDHLVRSIKRSTSPYSLRYIGPEWSFLAIFGKENYETFFGQVVIEKEALDIPYQHPYPFFFENNWSFFNNYLAELKAGGLSMFAHTGVFDHRQHGEHRGLGPSGTEFPRTDRMAKVMNTDFKAVKDWIDKNDDYLLLLISDHGVDEYGVAGYRMHGLSQDGNEPFVMVYNPKMEPKAEIRIDIVDVAPTLSMYLENVDIPLNSMGLAQPFFGENKTDVSVRVMKQNIAQLSDSAYERGQGVDLSKVQQLMDLPETEASLNKLLEYANELKISMYEVMGTAYLSIAFFTIASSASVLFILIQYNDGLEHYVFTNNVAGFVGELWSILVIYGLMFLQLLFCWWSWDKPHDGGFVWRTMSPGLAFIMIRYGRLSAKDAKVSPVESLTYANETINLALIFLMSCFPDMLPFFDGLPLVLDSTVVAAFFLVWYCYRAKARKGSPGSKWEPILFYSLIAMLWVFSYTEEWGAAFVSHFHWCALATYVMTPVLCIYFLAVNRIADLVLPLNLVLFLLFKDSPTCRWLLFLFNYQYTAHILPAIEQFRIRVTALTLLGSVDGTKQQSASIGHQAAIVYAINQVFFTFTFAFGDKINFDVHPFAGRVGLDAYDQYPALSAFLMTFHKYGIFSLFCVYAWQIVQLQVQEGKEEKPALYTRSSALLSNRLSDLMTVAIVLLFSMANLGMYLMLWIATRHHPQEQATATTLLVGVIGSVYGIFHLVDSIRKRNLEDAHH